LALVHHAEARAWLARQPQRLWPTCAITQLALLRLISNPKLVGENISAAQAMKAQITLTDQAAHLLA
jgi:predicted nucleic acid-binding protein